MNHPILFLIGVLCASAATGIAEPVAGNLPAPDAKAQGKAEAAVREIYKAEFAKRGTSDRHALAVRLLAEGEKTGDDPSAKYVLLRDAAEIAVSAGDYATADQALRVLGESFAVDAQVMEFDTLQKAGTPANPDAARAAADAYGALVERCLAAGHYEVAARAAPAGTAVARKTRDASLVSRFETLERDARELRAEELKFNFAQATLAAKPDSAEANLATGRFLCFVRGDWSGGLPLLAKGSDAAIRALAAAEAAGPAGPKEQAAIADGWYDLAAKERTRAAQANLRAHAAKWYAEAAPNLPGLERVRVEKRLSETGPKSAASDSPTDASTSTPAKPVTVTPASLSAEERSSLLAQKKDLVAEAKGQTDKRKRLETLTEAAKLTLQLDPRAGMAELDEIIRMATEANDADRAGYALIAQGEYLGSIDRWKDAEAKLAIVWKKFRGNYGDRGCTAAQIMAKHFIALNRPAAAVPYQEITMDCGGTNDGAAGDAALWLADYYLEKGDKPKAITYLKRVIDKYRGPYDSCKEKAEKKLNEIRGT